MKTKISNNFERQALLDEARQVVEKVKAEHRDLTTAETVEVDRAFATVKAWDEESRKSREQFDAWLAATSHTSGDMFIDDDRHGLFTDSEKAAFVHAIRSKTSFSATVPLTSRRLKAPMDTGALELPGVGTSVVANPDPKSTIALRDLLTPAVAGGPTVRYYTIGEPGVGDVAIVAEGGLKPEAEVAYAPVDAELVKLATRFTITDELREDAGFLLTEIQSSVLRAVLARENKLIVDTIAATSGILTGTGAAATLLDILADEIGASEAINGQTPTALVLNPSNLASVRIAKASTGGSYFIDPLAAGPTMIHGVPLISTPAVAAGTAYLLTQGFGTFYTRGSLRVEAGHTGDDFIYNRSTIRAEERVLPVVNRPNLVTAITLT